MCTRTATSAPQHLESWGNQITGSVHKNTDRCAKLAPWGEGATEHTVQMKDKLLLEGGALLPLFCICTQDAVRSNFQQYKCKNDSSGLVSLSAVRKSKRLEV